MTYYHGGRGGMKKGQYILPPSITKVKSLRAYGNFLCDITKVYVTTDFDSAAMYAAGVYGDIYEVEPIGELNNDPDCLISGLSFSCDKARIIKRYRLSKNKRNSIIDILIHDS